MQSNDIIVTYVLDGAKLMTYRFFLIRKLNNKLELYYIIVSFELYNFLRLIGHPLLTFCSFTPGSFTTALLHGWRDFSLWSQRIGKIKSLVKCQNMVTVFLHF